MTRAIHRPMTGALLLALPLALGCPAEKKADPAKTAQAEKKVEKKAEPDKPAAKTADPVCMAAWSAKGEAQKVEAGGRTFEVTGTHLKETSSDEDKKAVLGLLANTKEDTKENLANIDKALAFFKKKGVDAIVIAGDLGETKSQMVNVLEPVLAAGLPVFTIIGNREKKTDYAAAMKAMQAKHPHLVDMNQVRLVSMDDVALVSVPGYYDAAYIHAEDGCQYFPGDLQATKAIVKAAGATPTVLVSHGPPKQAGAEALDRTLEQANVGDANLGTFIDEAGVKFGVFANIQEAGGRGTDASGETLVKPGEASAELFVNPGAIDAVSWEMNDGSRSVGMAAVFTMDGGKASYEVFKLVDEG